MTKPSMSQPTPSPKMPARASILAIERYASARQDGGPLEPI